MEQLGFQLTDILEIWHLSIFLENSAEKIQVPLKSDKNNNRHFT